MYPRSSAISAELFIDRPTKATLRPCSHAISTASLIR